MFACSFSVYGISFGVHSLISDTGNLWILSCFSWSAYFVNYIDCFEELVWVQFPLWSVLNYVDFCSLIFLYCFRFNFLFFFQFLLQYTNRCYIVFSFLLDSNFHNCPRNLPCPIGCFEARCVIYKRLEIFFLIFSRYRFLISFCYGQWKHLEWFLFMLLNWLGYVLWTRIWSILVHVSWALENEAYSTVFGKVFYQFD